MLAEYALNPDVFDDSCYSVPEVCDVHLQSLKEPLLQEALVRDLRSGDWRKFVEDMPNRHPRAKELLRKLINQNRLRKANAALPQQPEDYRGWCQEAIGSHELAPLQGIITSNNLAEEFCEHLEVASVEKLSNAPWWQNRSPSVRLIKNTAEYLQHLGLILSHSNSLMFIDPHIYPANQQYGEFVELLKAAHHPAVTTLVEIHRVCYVGSGPNKEFLKEPEVRKDFTSTLRTALSGLKLRVEVFVWDDFHDRYLISDIVGVNLPYGFDVTTNPNAQTTWTRLGRNERDDIQREFDPASNRHSLRYRFVLPA